MVAFAVAPATWSRRAEVGRFPAAAAVARRPRLPRRTAPCTVVVFSRSGSVAALSFEDEPQEHVRFVGEVADEVALFMNTELKNHLASYVCKFGHKVKDMRLIDQININSLSRDGLCIDVVTCDHDGCVCVQEELPWLEGAHLSSPEQVPDELRKMSLACGLPVDVF